MVGCKLNKETQKNAKVSSSPEIQILPPGDKIDESKFSIVVGTLESTDPILYHITEVEKGYIPTNEIVWPCYNNGYRRSSNWSVPTNAILILQTKPTSEMVKNSVSHNLIGDDLQKGILPYSEQLLSAITTAESIVDILADKKPIAIQKAKQIAENYIKNDDIWKNIDGNWSAKRFAFSWRVHFEPLMLEYPDICLYISDDGRIVGEYIGT